MRSGHRPCKQTDPEDWHEEYLYQEDPAQCGHTEKEKRERHKPEDGEAEKFSRGYVSTCWYSVCVPVGERWPDGLNHSLNCQTACVGLDTVPYGSDNCPNNDGEVGAPKAEGPRRGNQSSPEELGDAIRSRDDWKIDRVLILPALSAHGRLTPGKHDHCASRCRNTRGHGE